MKGLSGITVIFSLVGIFFYSSANAASANVEIRADGVGVFPDTINGHNAMAMNRSPIRFIFSAESDFVVAAATLGFRFYSPDVSISYAFHFENNNTGYDIDDPFPVWNTPFTLGGTVYNFKDWDGLLPDTFITGGAAFSGGFGPTELVDIFALTMSFPDDTSGVFCIDSTFVAPAAPWLFANGTNIAPAWGSSVGGYPDGGYCITIYPGCCFVPGDADYGGDVNIADAIFIEKYIFQDGMTPFCLGDADADGGGDINIGDVVFLVRYIFQDGAAPSCAP
ncbi:MAG: hypothetical protein IIB00_06735 [candidate division Zixibacteria bacterium]|nr:hypothetical protein [candidate division Zixibacteria bacterium]